ncbi:MAG TPA: membrane protein insertase YidC, partial [Terracidiphilus sp.]
MPEFQNPNLQSQGGPGGSGGGGGDLRSMLAIGSLLVAVFLGYQIFFNKPKPETQQPTQTQSQTQQSAQTGQQGATPAGSQNAAAHTPTAAAPAIAAEAESETTVENANYKIVFTNKGAQVKHWILKGYNDSAGKPLDLVQGEAAALFGKPLSFFTYEPELTKELNSALYQASATG